jgi:hypothetical protein
VTTPVATRREKDETTTMEDDDSDDSDRAVVDVVTEIRLRWARLGKVASFKRIVLRE